MKNVAMQVLSSLEQTAQDKNITIHTNICETVPKLWGNESKLKSMISNLVNNAVKFTPEGGTVRVEIKHRHQEIIIIISDTGMGIAQQDIPKIFERFYRVQQSDRQIPGTGLGLAIVNEVASLHGGKVEVESQLGHGTTFQILLPLTGRLEFENTGIKVSNMN